MNSSKGGLAPTDFLTFLPQAGLAASRLQRRTTVLGDLARSRGFAQLDDKGSALPLWVASPSKWRVSRTPEGDWTAVCSEQSDQSFHGTDRTGPGSVRSDRMGIA